MIFCLVDILSEYLWHGFSLGQWLLTRVCRSLCHRGQDTPDPSHDCSWHTIFYFSLKGSVNVHMKVVGIGTPWCKVKNHCFRLMSPVIMLNLRRWKYWFENKRKTAMQLKYIWYRKASSFKIRTVFLKINMTVGMLVKRFQLLKVGILCNPSFWKQQGLDLKKKKSNM